MVVFFSFFAPDLPMWVDDALNAPAMLLDSLAQAIGVVTKGDSTSAMPLVFGFIQWFVVGSLIGFYRWRRAQRSLSRAAHNGTDER
jgi:hypothetical protein